MSAVQLNHQINWRDEFVKRIPQKKQPSIQTQVNQVKAENITALTKAIESDDWAREAPLTHADMPFVALVAYQTKAIAAVQFSTLLNFWTAVNRYGAQAIRTFSLKSLEGVLVATTAFDPLSIKKLGSKIVDLSAKVLQRGPASECHFFVVEAPPEPANSGFTRLSEIGYIPFLSSTIGSKKVKVIASCTMMMVHLEMFYQNPVRPNLVIGVSSHAELMLNARTHSRDIGHSFPSHLLPLNGDSYHWYGEDYQRHDWTHAARASNVPPYHQGLLIDLAEICNEAWIQRKEATNLSFPFKVWHLIRTYEEDANGTMLREMRGAFIDMDFPNYTCWDCPTVRFTEFTLAERFWEAVFLVLHKKGHLNTIDELELLTKISKKMAHEDVSFHQPLSSEFTSFSVQNLIWTLKGSNMSICTSLVHQTTQIWKSLKNPQEFVHDFKGKIEGKNPAEVKAYLNHYAKHFFHPNNILAIFEAAKNEKVRPLIQAAMIYIAENFFDVIQTRAFETYRVMFQDDLTSLLDQIKKSRFYGQAVKENALLLYSQAKNFVEIIEFIEGKAPTQAAGAKK